MARAYDTMHSLSVRFFRDGLEGRLGLIPDPNNIWRDMEREHLDAPDSFQPFQVPLNLGSQTLESEPEMLAVTQ
eukprot:3485997-Rhodomonas_salina.1